MSYRAKAPEPRETEMQFTVTFHGDPGHAFLTTAWQDMEQKVAHLLAAELEVDTTVSYEPPF
jgi:hypothetical protein